MRISLLFFVEIKKHFMALGAHPASKVLKRCSRIGKLAKSKQIRERRVGHEHTDDGRAAWRKR